MAILDGGEYMLIRFNLSTENISTDHIFEVLEEDEFQVQFLFKPDYCIIQLINYNAIICYEFRLPKSFFVDYPVYSSFKLHITEIVKPKQFSLCIIDTVKRKMMISYEKVVFEDDCGSYTEFVSEEIPLKYGEFPLKMVPFADCELFPVYPLLCSIDDLRDVVDSKKDYILIKQSVTHDGKSLSLTPFNGEDVSRSLVFRRNVDFADYIGVMGVNKSEYHMNYFKQIISLYPYFSHANFYINFIPSNEPCILGLRGVYNNDVMITSYLAPRILAEDYKTDFIYEGDV